jgi:Na+-driven multidrug efflux pump
MAVLKFSLCLALGLSAVMTVICYAFAGPLVTAFLDDADAFEYGMRFARIYIYSGPILGVLFILMNAIQSTGAALPSLILSLSRQGILFIPTILILNTFNNASILSMAQPITDYLATMVAVILFIVTYRKYLMRMGEAAE